ncbi:MAG: regulatory protein RecX [Bacillota bacterium]
MADDGGDKVAAKALSYVYRLLARRDYTLAALRERLSRRGYPGETVDYVLGEIRRLELVDDEDYARRYVTHVLEHKPQGRAKICRDLNGRGVERALARRVVDQLVDEEAELDMARRALASKGGTYDRIHEDRRSEARFYRFLKGRGFRDRVIRTALRVPEGSHRDQFS